MAGLSHSLAHTRPSLPRAPAWGFCAPRPTILTPWNWTEVPPGAGAWAPGWQAAGLVPLPGSRQLVSWACGGVSRTMLPCVPASGGCQGEPWVTAGLALPRPSYSAVMGGWGVAARPRDPAGGPAWGLSKGVFLETRPVFVLCESGVLLLREGFISFCGQFFSFSSEVIPH